VYLSYDFSGLPGGDTFGLVWAEGDFPPLEDNLPLIFPPGTGAQNDEHTWALYYNFYQYLTLLDGDPDRGWGLFGRLNFADDETNPIQWMASFGVGGQGVVPDRPDDRFGLGYFYLATADDAIINNLPPPGVDDEQGIEIFYDFAVTPYLRVAPDVQFIDNGIGGAEDSWVVALRAYLQL
jgi:porin